MTLSLASHTILETKSEGDVPYSVPFGRTGCALLPDGSFVAAVYYDSSPTDLIRVWKLDTDGALLGDVVVDTGADDDGRMHLVALDGFLVQALYMTGNNPGGLSMVFDCSGDDPVLVGQWEDTLGTNGYGSDASNVYSLYLRASGLVVVQHGNGVSLYRRGRPLVSREGIFGGGGSGLFAHPTDTSRCAFWSYTATSGAEWEAFEVEVVSDNLITVEPLGITVPSADIWWVVGAGSPYATTPVILQEDDNELMKITEAETPLVTLWTDPEADRVPVALTGEAFWSTAAWGTPLADTANEYWVGSAPRLTSVDDDTSHAFFGTADFGTTRVVAALDAATMSVGEGLDVELRLMTIGFPGVSTSTQVHVGTSASSTPLDSFTITLPSFQRGSWVDEVAFFPYSAPLAAALAAGDVVVWVAPPGVGYSFKVSAVTCGVGLPYKGINSDALATGVGDGVDRWAFCHEVYVDYGPDSANPSRAAFAIRAGLVDNSTGTPAVDQLLLEYDITTPDGYPEDEFAVSLFTGSHAITHRNGEIVISTCIVQQNGAVDYFCVVVWKLTGGDVQRFSGLDGAWRLGINNATGLTGLQTSDGFLLEAGEGPGLDAAAHAALIKTSDEWKVLGRYVEDGAPTLPEPVPPPTVDVVFTPTDFNDDLAAAAALAGASLTVGANSYGAFVAQASPPAVGDLSDGSDVTFTTLVQPNRTGSDVEVLTARMTPDSVIPPTSSPVGAAIRIRGRATAGADLHLDAQITTIGSSTAIRGKSGTYNLRLTYDMLSTITDSHWGAGNLVLSDLNVPPAQNPSGYTTDTSLEDAMTSGTALGAQWWHDYLTTPGNYLVLQSAATNLAHGDLEVFEFSITIRYLIE